MSASKQHSLEPPGTKEVCVYLQALFCWMFLRKTGTGKEPKESPPHSTQIQNPAHFWDFFFPSKAKALNCWGSGENPPVPKVLSEIPRPWERRGKAACHWGGLTQEPLLLWEGQDTLSPAIPDKGTLPYGRSGSKSHLSLEDKQKTYSGQDPALTQSRGQLPLKEERETLTQDTLPPPQIKEQKYSSPRGKKQEHGESPTSKAHANGPAWAWGWTRRREDFTAPTKNLAPHTGRERITEEGKASSIAGPAKSRGWGGNSEKPQNLRPHANNRISRNSSRIWPLAASEVCGVKVKCSNRKTQTHRNYQLDWINLLQ